MQDDHKYLVDDRINRDERIKRLAADKSNLQVVLHLINKVAAVTGLEKSITTILRSIGEVIGGNNLCLYYWIDEAVYCADLYGVQQKVAAIEDSLVLHAIAMGKPVEVKHKITGKDLDGKDYLQEFSWIVPLKIGNNLIGVLKMERLNMGMQQLSQQLTPFFHFVALSLNNEISSQTRLKQAYDRLAEEVAVRKEAEAALSIANTNLENRVEERTKEVEESNRLLKKNEVLYQELLTRMAADQQVLIKTLEDRKAVETRLKQSEEQFRALFENSPIGLWLEDFSGVKTRLDALRAAGVQDIGAYLLANPDEVKCMAGQIKVLLMNQVSLNLLGAQGSDVVSRELSSIFDASTWVVFTQEMIAIAEGKTIFSSEMTIRNLSDKELTLVLIMVVPPGFESSLEHVIVSLLDITEHKQAEKRIKVLLTEKEILLREVHHRIKNNMSTITTLLNMQISSQKDPSARLALLDAAGRVQSMMVLYDKLYRSGDFGAISLQEYVSTLTEDVVDLFSNKHTVQVFVDIADISLPPRLLTPLGIILNELITNSMKYAFPQKRPAFEDRIFVSAVQFERRCQIIFEDNGIGLPENFSMNNSPGFGMQLVRLLIDQIEGSIQIESNPGAKFTIEFEF